MNAFETRQSTVLAFIEDFWKEHGYGPSLREIEEGCELGSTSVAEYHLHELERKGLIRRTREVARSVRPANFGECPLCKCPGGCR